MNVQDQIKAVQDYFNANPGTYPPERPDYGRSSATAPAPKRKLPLNHACRFCRDNTCHFPGPEKGNQ